MEPSQLLSFLSCSALIRDSSLQQSLAPLGTLHNLGAELAGRRGHWARGCLDLPRQGHSDERGKYLVCGEEQSGILRKNFGHAEGCWAQD